MVFEDKYQLDGRWTREFGAAVAKHEEDEECPKKGQVRDKDGKCVDSGEPECPEGTSYNSLSGQCEPDGDADPDAEDDDQAIRDASWELKAQGLEGMRVEITGLCRLFKEYTVQKSG